MSSTIAFIESQLEKRRLFLSESEKSVKSLPEDKAALFFMESDDEQVKVLEQQLRIEKSARAYELFEMRLHGGPTGAGTLPLKLLGKFSLPIAEAIEKAAFRLHKGQEAVRGVPKHLSELLNLQLAGLNSGSARLMITGNLSPDLAGASVLENTLRQIFRLFAADEDFYDAVDAIGVKAAHKISESFKALEDENCAVDFGWRTPDGATLTWKGTLIKIAQIREKLESLTEPEIFTQQIDGEISSLKTSGILEIKDLLSIKHKVRHSMEQQPIVAELKLWQKIVMTVRTERTYDNIAHQWKEKHHLISLN